MGQRKVAFITGASRGIGRACALELARRDFDLVLTARTVSGHERYEHSSTVRTSRTEPLPGSLERTAAEAQALRAETLVAKLDLSIRLMPGFVGTERMAVELGEFGFDASKALPVENPGRVCAMLATAKDPLFFSGRDVYGPDLYAQMAGLRFEERPDVRGSQNHENTKE